MTRPLGELEEVARDIGHTIGGALPEGVGFALMIFDFGPGGHMTYLSNAGRAEMVKALRETVAMVERAGPR